MAGEDLLHHVGVARGDGAGLVEVGGLEDDQAADGVASLVEQRAGVTDASGRRQALQSLEVGRAVERALKN